MRRCLTALLVVGLVSINSRDAVAQPSESDVAAYAALLATPVGAFAPMNAAPVKDGANSNALAVRLSHWKAKGATDGNNNFGATYLRQAGQNAVIGGTLAYFAPGCTGCDGVLMLGADVNSRLWGSTPAAGSTTHTSINLQGSLGYGMDQADAAIATNALSVAVGVPFSISMDQASKARISAFITPGFGYGSLSGDGTAGLTDKSGSRPFVGGGAEWTSAAGWGLHLGVQKVIIEDGATNIGAGFTWKFGK